MGHLRGPRGDVRLRLQRLLPRRCDTALNHLIAPRCINAIDASKTHAIDRPRRLPLRAPCDDLLDVASRPTAGDRTCDIAPNDATCAYDGGDCCRGRRRPCASASVLSRRAATRPRPEHHDRAACVLLRLYGAFVLNTRASSGTPSTRRLLDSTQAHAAVEAVVPHASATPA